MSVLRIRAGTQEDDGKEFGNCASDLPIDEVLLDCVDHNSIVISESREVRSRPPSASNRHTSTSTSNPRMSNT